MVGPLDPAPPATNDRAESEAEAANRQNIAAEVRLEDTRNNAGFGEPGGQDAQSAGGTGPTGATAATTEKPGGMTSEGEPDSGGAREGGDDIKGMLGEGV